ncbi:MAG: AMP-binding protein [Streptosporangiaceae bacterium]
MFRGSAVPRSLIEAYEQRLGACIVQGWGLTETSPVASLAFPPKNAPAEQAMAYRATAGRALGGVEARVADEEGRVLPCDGRSTGEIEVRGPWVTGGYYRDPAAAKFRDGWPRTGDVGRIDREAAVIATPDERCGERPLACAVCAPGALVSPAELRSHLSGLVVKWWVPEKWAFVDEVPRTSVGKYDKKLLRARHAAGSLAVVTSDQPPAAPAG